MFSLDAHKGNASLRDRCTAFSGSAVINIKAGRLPALLPLPSSLKWMGLEISWVLLRPLPLCHDSFYGDSLQAAHSCLKRK